MIRSAGRPFDERLDKALLDSTYSLLTEKGFSGASVSEIASNAGTTRGAFYRRYRDLLDVTIALLLDRFSIANPIQFDNGSLREDLLSIQTQRMVFYSDPLVLRAMTGFVEALKADPERSAVFWRQFVIPWREVLSDALSKAEARGEISPGYDPDWIYDLLTAPFFLRVDVPTSGAINQDLVHKTVSAAIAVLHAAHEAATKRQN